MPLDTSLIVFASHRPGSRYEPSWPATCRRCVIRTRAWPRSCWRRGDLALTVAMDVSMVVGVGEAARGAYVAAKVATKVGEEVVTHVGEHVAEDMTAHASEHVAEGAVEHAGEDAGEHGMETLCKLSFSPDTPVATPSGEQAIGTLAVGDKVTAYDPSSGKTSTQTVQHVFINHDNDLLDVTLASADTNGQQSEATETTSKQQQAAVASHGLRAPPTEHDGARATSTTTETVHTTQKHPCLTTDRGWVL